MTRSPIATAPREEERRLLLFCPIEGWITREWFEGRWVDALTLERELQPTWWTDVPPEPETAADEQLAIMLAEAGLSPPSRN